MADHPRGTNDADQSAGKVAPIGGRRFLHSRRAIALSIVGIILVIAVGFTAVRTIARVRHSDGTPKRSGSPTLRLSGVALVTPDSIGGESHVNIEQDAKLRDNLSNDLGSPRQVVGAYYGRTPGKPDHMVLVATGPIEHNFDLYLMHTTGINPASRLEITRGALVLECYYNNPGGGSVCVWGENQFVGAAFDMNSNDLELTAYFAAAAYHAVKAG